MKPLTLLLLAFTIATVAPAQEAQFYVDLDGNKQLCGPFPVEVLEQDPAFSSWYAESYSAFEFQVNYPAWTDFYRDIEVEIFLGTWCYDSQIWVPRFIKAWDEMGMDRSQIRFIALYGDMEDPSKYKKAPHGEEIGKDIQRVPTFIFLKNGEEIARIVESPMNDLKTDLAQIFLDFPANLN